MEKEFFFTRKDLKRLFMRRKKLYIRLFFLGAFFVLLVNLSFPPLYKANAVFKYASQEGGESELLRSFLQKSSFSFKESGVQSVLESRSILKRVVEDLGLNIEVQRPAILKWLTSAKDRIWTEMGLALPQRDILQFSHTRFDGFLPLEGAIRFLDKSSFEVLDSLGYVVARGDVGFQVEFQDAIFTVKTVKSPEPLRLYRFRISPWIDTVDKVHSELSIKSSKKDKNVLHLLFAHPKKEVAASFLNQLMSSYQDYLKKENEDISSLQMEYLEKRQKELLQKYEHSLEEHVAFLSTSLESTGFLTFKQEIDLLEKPNEEYLSRLYDVDLTLSRLLPKEEKEGVRSIHLCQEKAEQKSSLRGMDNLILEKENGKKNFDLALERISERPIQQDVDCQEFEGLSVEAAQKLTAQYNQEWDFLRMKIEQLTHVQKQMMHADFEITSLSGILDDAVSQEIIQKASRFAFEKQDRVNYSDKDVERIEKGIEIQKQFVSQHVLQLLESYRLRSSVLESKIASLQKTTVHLLGIEKKLIQKQLDSLHTKMQSLPEKWKRESQLLMQRDLSLGVVEGLTQLAESKNIHHQLFQVESKPIDRAFVSYKASKVYLLGQCFLFGMILAAIAFGRHFLRWLLKGTAITADTAKMLGVTFCGFLEKAGFCRLEEVRGEDKESLRRISAFISSYHAEKQSVCVSFFGKPLCHLIANIGSLLSLRGLKVLVVDCTPPLRHGQNQIGLYDYLMDKGPVTALQKEGVDWIAPGSYHGSFTELLCRKSFFALIAEKKKSYDVIILSMEIEASAIEGNSLKEVSDISIVYGEDVFYEDAFSKKPLAVVLT